MHSDIVAGRAASVDLPQLERSTGRFGASEAVAPVQQYQDSYHDRSDDKRNHKAEPEDESTGVHVFVAARMTQQHSGPS